MLFHINNQRGSSMVGALMVMMVLGYMGAAVVQISSSDQVQSVHEVHGVQAINVSTAGLEWARRQVDQGNNPDVTDKEFGVGSFTVTSNSDAGIVTVVAKVGDAVRSQTISVDFGDDVISIDVDESKTGASSDSDGVDSDGDGSDADSGGGDLSGVTLVKDGNSAITVTQVTLDWNWSECVRKASCSENYEDYLCVAGQTSKDDGSDDESKDDDSDDGSEDDESDNESKDDDSDDDSSDGTVKSAKKVGFAEKDDDDSGDSDDDSSDDNSSDSDDDASEDNDSDDASKDDESDDDDSKDSDDKEEEVDSDKCTDTQNVAVCHVPSGNPDNAHTIYISVNGWLNGHINHAGDFLGECNSQCKQKDEVDMADILECDDDDGGAAIDKIEFGDVVVFKAGEIPADSTPAGDGETIDILDSTLSDDGEYVFKSIHFSEDHPGGGLYNMTVDFADGSSATKTWIDTVKSEEQTAEAEAAEGAYEVDDGSLSVAKDKKVTVQVLGSAITCGAGGPEINVTAQLGVNGEYSSMFNGADVDGGETHTITTSDTTSYTIRATASLSSCGGFSRTLTSTDTVHVYTLVNGDAAPKLEGFGGQKPVTEFLQDYLDAAGNVVLAQNWVIQLWEMGVDVSLNPTSTAADFQDLVILFTIEDQKLQ